MSKIRGLPHSQLLKTGQTISYADGDDGDLQKGIAKRFTIRSTGAQSGTTAITINGKTANVSNNVVHDENTGLDWQRFVVTSDIGPGADGRLFWSQWTLGPKTDISFDAASKTINSVGGDFSADALCAGRIFLISGSGSNDGEYTVASISANNLVTVEALSDESAGASVSIETVGGLIWDFLAQANANALGGYMDWRVPNSHSEFISIVNLGNCSPCIDTVAFPSTPTDYHWSASAYPCGSALAWLVHFGDGYVGYGYKQSYRRYVRVVRG